MSVSKDHADAEQGTRPAQGELDFNEATILATIRGLPPTVADGRLKALLSGLTRLCLKHRDDPERVERLEDGRFALGPPVPSIADAAGSSESTIQRALRALRKNGNRSPFLELSNDCDHAPHVYVLNPAALFNVEPKPEPVAKPATEAGSRGSRGAGGWAVPRGVSAREKGVSTARRGVSGEGASGVSFEAPSGVSNDGASARDTTSHKPDLDLADKDSRARSRSGQETTGPSSAQQAVAESGTAVATDRRRMPNRWPLDIEPAELQDPDAVEELWGLAVAAGWAEGSQDGRLRFFRLAQHSLRDGKSPGAMLTANLREGRWFGNDADEDGARAMMRRADGNAPRPRVRDSPEAGDEPDDDARRRVQLARLGERYPQTRRTDGAMAQNRPGSCPSGRPADGQDDGQDDRNGGGHDAPTDAPL